MPFFVRVSDHHCREFLSRPNTCKLRFPRGSDFFFSLPFDMNSLFRMRPDELFALHKFLSRSIKDKTAAELWNMRHVQVVILRRLAGAKGLGSVEHRAWAAGHGYPVFDTNNILTGFLWNWKLIEFEGGKDLVFMYKDAISGQDRQQAMNRSATEEATTVLCWEGNEHEDFVCQRHGQTVCFYIYGAYFRDFAGWEHVEAKLTEQELDELDRGLVMLRNRPGGGYSLLLVKSEEEQGSKRTRPERRHALDAVVPANRSYQSTPSYSYPSSQDCCYTISLTAHTPYYSTSTIGLTDEPTKYKQPPIKPTIPAKDSDTRTNNLINVYGAIFEGENDWLAFASTLTNAALYCLSHGILNLRGCTHNGIAVTWGPRADARLEETDDEDSTGHYSYRDNRVCNRNIRRCTQPLDFAPPRVYRGMRDNDTPEQVATKQLAQLKAMAMQRHSQGKKRPRPSCGSRALCFLDRVEQDAREKHEQETTGSDRKESSGSSNKRYHGENSRPIPGSKAELPCPQTPLASASTCSNLYTSTQIQPTYDPLSAQQMRASSTAWQNGKPKYQAYAEESSDELHQVRAVEGSWRDV